MSSSTKHLARLVDVDGGDTRVIATVAPGETTAFSVVEDPGASDGELQLTWGELGFFLAFSGAESGFVTVDGEEVPPGARVRLRHGAPVCWRRGVFATTARFEDVRGSHEGALEFHGQWRTWMPRAVLEVGGTPITVELGSDELRVGRDNEIVAAAADAWITLYWHPDGETVAVVAELAGEPQARRALARGDRVDRGNASVVVRRLAVPRTELRITRAGPHVVYVPDPSDPDDERVA